MPEPERAPSEPPETVMSSSFTKFVVASLAVNVRDKVPSFDVPPSLTSDAVIVIVGAVVSKLAVTLVEFDVAVTAVPEFPTVSSKAML